MTIFIFGEAMLEYHSRGGADGLRYGGDTLNTAIHMARLGLDVAYVTAVGTDPISDALVAAWADEGVDTRYILRHPRRGPGIYAIHVDPQGERSFLYWREMSAAREMFALPEMAKVLPHAAQASLLYFSLITLAILPDDGQAALLELAKTVRCNGGKVAYDSNFRAKLWPELATARRLSAAAMGVCDIGLPTNVDEQTLFEEDAPESEVAKRWLDAGCGEVLVKAGENGCFYCEGLADMRHVEPKIVAVVDSSGAGDAFNGGYLAKRLQGGDIADAIKAGQELAAWSIQRKGAIPDRDS